VKYLEILPRFFGSTYIVEITVFDKIEKKNKLIINCFGGFLREAQLTGILLEGNIILHKDLIKKRIVIFESFHNPFYNYWKSMQNNRVLLKTAHQHLSHILSCHEQRPCYSH